MQASLERHDEILRSAIVDRGGYGFSTAGDAFSAAFARVEEGVRAAVWAQRARAEEVWPDGLSIGVWMGLHTGEEQERAGDYFGSTVNRAARIMSFAHGGQVLVSAATTQLLADTRVELREVGELSLKGLVRPETVSQLVAEGLRSEFPALRVQRERLGNLPLSRDSFVGREQELLRLEEILKQRFRGCRLVRHDHWSRPSQRR
jgi:class 3 adenylate cyclase